MAAPPNRLGTHDRGTSFTGEREERVDAFAELRGLHIVGIPAKRKVTPGGVVRIGANLSAAAELFDRPVFDAGRGERCCQRFGVELRKFSRTRMAADVREQFDLVRRQQFDEFLDRTCRVADRPDGKVV